MQPKVYPSKGLQIGKMNEPYDDSGENFLIRGFFYITKSKYLKCFILLKKKMHETLKHTYVR